jgi:hypothetical protein
MIDLCVRSNLLSTSQRTLERKIEQWVNYRNVGSFGKLRRDKKKSKERKNVRIAADLPADQTDL